MEPLNQLSKLGALECVEADVLDAASIEAAVKGAPACGGVTRVTAGDIDVVGIFHTACPFFFTEENPQEQLVRPSVEGTLNVLKAASASPSARRVSIPQLFSHPAYLAALTPALCVPYAPPTGPIVMTSSFAAILNTNAAPDFVFVESHWHSISVPDADGNMPAPAANNWYRYWYSSPSILPNRKKTKAEKAAWEYMDTEQPPFDLGCINPPMVLGPNLNAVADVNHLNTSSKVV
eukprot:gene3531-3982_t